MSANGLMPQEVDKRPRRQMPRAVLSCSLFAELAVRPVGRGTAAEVV